VPPQAPKTLQANLSAWYSFKHYSIFHKTIPLMLKVKQGAENITFLSILVRLGEGIASISTAMWSFNNLDFAITYCL